VHSARFSFVIIDLSCDTALSYSVTNALSDDIIRCMEGGLSGINLKTRDRSAYCVTLSSLKRSSERAPYNGFSCRYTW
jgi:hypothetical protein